jgi:hypothetical protein
MRRGMYCGTLPIPVTRSSVVAVWRVFVSDHSGWPVISQSLATHSSGAAAASSAKCASRDLCSAHPSPVWLDLSPAPEVPAGSCAVSWRAPIARYSQ